MRESEFAALVAEFVERYRCDGWELRGSGGGAYAVNARRPIPGSGDLLANYYVSFDAAFAVPVLSATFYDAAGRRLTHDELMRLIPERLDPGSVSERELDATGEPVFFVHPCRTEEFVRPFLQSGGENYLHVFMVRYGPVFLYRLPF